MSGPRSRRNPQLNSEALARQLPRQGITVVWLGEDLGGFRQGGYPAWMESAAFQRGLAQLEELAEGQLTALMCAETVWFRCHRRFIARHLVARGYRVTHLLQVGKDGHEEPGLAGAEFALSVNSASIRALQEAPAPAVIYRRSHACPPLPCSTFRWSASGSARSCSCAWPVAPCPGATW